MGNSTSSRRSHSIVRRLHSHITALNPAFISVIDESTQIFTFAVEEAFTLVAEIKFDQQLSPVVSLPQSLTYTPYIEKELKDAYQTFLDDYPSTITKLIPASRFSNKIFRIPSDLEIGHPLADRFWSRRTCKGNLRGLYGWMSIPRKPGSKSYRFPEAERTG